MIIEIIFIFTAAMILTGSVKLIGHLVGNSMSLPHIVPYTDLTPTYYLIWYPSAMFQVWFWAHYFGVLA